MLMARRVVLQGLIASSVLRASRGTAQVTATAPVQAAGPVEVDADAFVFFALAVTDLTMRSLIQAINLARNNQPRDIYLFIDSVGGSIEAAVDFYNYVGSLDRRIHTVNMSRVSSAANYLYLAGERRYAFPASYFMLHPGKSTAAIQGVTQQSFDDLKSQLAYSEGLMKTILQKRALFPKDELERIFRSENFYDYDQARRYGLVNTPGRPTVRLSDSVTICSENEAVYLKDY